MAAFNKFFASVLLAVLYATTATLAVPFAPDAKYTTHRVRNVGRDLQIETYHPESTYETFGAGVEHALSKRADATVEDATVAYISEKLGVSDDNVHIRSTSFIDGVSHAYVQQTVNGIPVANAVANIAFNSENKVVAFGSSFVKARSAKVSEPTVTVEDAIKAGEEALNGKFVADEFPEPSLEYVAQQDGSLKLAHVLQVRNEEAGTWYEAFVDAHTADVISVTDFVSKATYRVLPIQKQDPREGFETLADPQDTVASPQGWHSDGTTTTTTTAGNNVVAYKGATTATAAQSSSGQFIYTQSATQAPTTAANVAAAKVNAFYIVNTVHDIAYRYGFTEAAFNFQTNNFGKGGRANDRVTVSVQDSASINNADFSTPPDGQSGRMRMFLWDITNPQRDGSLENDIIVHEMTHGITNRLTGGGTGRCLQTTEAGGMGEGWSDALAVWTEQKTSSVPDITIGSYVINDSAGIRSNPYSTSASVNPLRYSTIRTLNEVHDIGEVWANLLHNVYASLVSAHGFAADAKTNPASTAGNSVFLHLFLDALALQPCNPTLPTARDAWIQADANRYSGANRCTLWRAFASRGLGVGAANHVDSTSVPSGC
ncbi:hypothetical protein QCA50_008842 [Cerrena zonata]|uniref:Extracellular metalloproteinase n=1 Tax=Cerrena zonata TaxID=2478898 RepID=A0AAW0G2R0_9APHY